MLDKGNLHYYLARVYSPTHSTFLLTDPIGYADGMNLYAYGGNDPTWLPCLRCKPKRNETVQKIAKIMRMQAVKQFGRWGIRYNVVS